MYIDGKNIAKKLYDGYKQEVSQFKTPAKLDIILVGNNPSSIRYITQKRKWSEYVGINFELHHLSEEISEKQLISLIQKLNHDENVTGFLVQLPLPYHIDERNIIHAIDPNKDVDGFHPINLGKIMIGDTSALVPCTPSGVMEILKHEKINLEGKIVTVIGRSNIVGKPMVNLLINAGATVICCNSKTKDLLQFTKNSDIVIIATGQKEMLTADMIKKDSTIIDVGFTVIDGKIYGDAQTKAIEEKGARITPVPGGVGALTVAMIMKNIIQIKK